MAPLTRQRSPNHVPTELVGEYYEQRASDGGLLISEGTLISPMVFYITSTPTDDRRGHIPMFLESGQMSKSPRGNPSLTAFMPRVAYSFVRYTPNLVQIDPKLWHVGRCTSPEVLPNGRLPLSSTDKVLEGTLGPPLH